MKEVYEMTNRTSGQKINKKKKRQKNDTHISFSLKYLTSSTHRKHYRKKINE